MWWLFDLTVLWFGLQCVIVVFPGHTRLIFSVDCHPVIWASIEILVLIALSSTEDSVESVHISTAFTARIYKILM